MHFGFLLIAFVALFSGLSAKAATPILPDKKEVEARETPAEAAARDARIAAIRARFNRPTDRPNVILIVADDLGYGDLGCYGQQKIKTPNIDRLASEGIRYTSFYAGCTVGAPSRASLMTGLHTGHTGIRGNGNGFLGTNDLTVAQVLKTRGYANMAAGKWGLGLMGTPGIPTLKGFDEWIGFLDQVHAHNYYPDYVYRNDQEMPIPDNQNGRERLYIQDYFSKASTNFVRLNEKHPFFMYLAFTIPHANSEKKTTGMQVPSDEPYSAEKWPQQEKNKAAMITLLDHDIGLLMDTLKQYKLDINTVVIFTSDNGPHKEGGVNPAFFKSSGELRGIKRDLYEGGIRVPMIVRWKDHVPAGITSDFVWAFWDLMPTIAEMAGTNVTAKIDGVSVLSSITSGVKAGASHDSFYWEFHEGGSKQAIRMGEWKAVKLTPSTAMELYNLQLDPREEKNVASANPEVVAKIENLFKTSRTESTEWPLKEPVPKGSPNVSNTPKPGVQ
ncbi:MAG: N-acetylgalactosamine-6-sulfatase [Verrucomicrobiales bacterium]|nr:N-acetylgalactosamine-6-sulfatase [Verrucomicrobiales bacterium]